MSRANKHSKPAGGKRRRKRLPRWADRLITIVIILIGVGLMTWPWILDRLEASGVFNQISTVSSTVDALSEEGLIGQNVCPSWGHRRRSMPLFQPFKFRARF